MPEEETKKEKSKSKHKKIQVWKKYEVEGNKVKRKRESCPRCGEGTFLAVHKNRKTCGKCGYSEISQKKKKE